LDKLSEFMGVGVALPAFSGKIMQKNDENCKNTQKISQNIQYTKIVSHKFKAKNQSVSH